MKGVNCLMEVPLTRIVSLKPQEEREDESFCSEVVTELHTHTEVKEIGKYAIDLFVL